MKTTRREFLKQGVFAAVGALCAMSPLVAATRKIAQPKMPASQKYSRKPDVSVIQPRALRRGTRAAVCAPSGAIYYPANINMFEYRLRTVDVSLTKGKTLGLYNGFFAGRDSDRIEDLNFMIADPAFRAVFAATGGWGCFRILHAIDYVGLKAKPKILCGYSDISALLLAANKLTGLVTFMGPNADSAWNDYTFLTCAGILSGTVSELKPPYGWQVTTLRGGQAAGRLVAANLSVLCGLAGTPYFPDLEGAILCVEEVGEHVLRVDRCLAQLRMMGVLRGLKGLLFGSCTNCSETGPLNAPTLRGILEEYFLPLNIPVCMNAPFGHLDSTWTIPIGVRAAFDATKGTLELLEPAVLKD